MMVSSILKKIFDKDKRMERKVKYHFMDNGLVFDDNFNDAEFRLLSYYQSFTDANGEKSKWDIFDEKTQKDLNWSHGKLARTKKKLKEKGYLYIVQVHATKYTYYFGKNAKEMYESTLIKEEK